MSILIFMVVLIAVIIIILLAMSLQDAHEHLDYADRELNEAKDRQEETDSKVKNLFITIAPLIEKTDWMTGRWHGQFSTLQDMEKDRNTLTVIVRKALFALPAIEDSTKEFQFPMVPADKLPPEPISAVKVSDEA